MDRRTFLKIGVTTAVSSAAGVSIRPDAEAGGNLLRPPGADPENFLSACIRCFKCGEVCPNKCIKFAGLGRGVANLFTPYLEPRDQACILCMKCAEACPTDALQKIGAEGEEILENVRMGTAEVDPYLCYSYNDRTCGVCYRACPFPDVALRLGLNATPVVNEKFCVGCGLCEKSCIHIPQAIRVSPHA
jgi:MauM/NapG family ferredoxin protein